MYSEGATSFLMSEPTLPNQLRFFDVESILKSIKCWKNTWESMTIFPTSSPLPSTSPVYRLKNLNIFAKLWILLSCLRSSLCVWLLLLGVPQSQGDLCQLRNQFFQQYLLMADFGRVNEPYKRDPACSSLIFEMELESLRRILILKNAQRLKSQAANYMKAEFGLLSHSLKMCAESVLEAQEDKMLQVEPLACYRNTVSGKG